MPRVRCFVLLATALLCGLAGRAAPDADQPTAGSFDAQGVRIRYWVEGHGEPVVLIHGLYSSAMMNWQMPGIMHALSRDHLVVALDLPGHGGSDKPERAAAYGVQMVEDVILLLDHLQIKQAHVVGYSLGGMGWLREGSRLQGFWERMGGRQGGRTPAACVNSIGRLALTEDALRAIQTPVIMLIGERDPVKKLYVAPLQAVRQDWRVIEIAGAGHLNCLTKKEFSEAMVKWVDQNRPK